MQVLLLPAQWKFGFVISSPSIFSRFDLRKGATMLVELHVDNPRHEILTGSYATIRMPANVLGRVLTLPDNTLIFPCKDLQVAVVDAKDVVQIRNVRVGRDFGVQSEILSGVTESDKVIVNPPTHSLLARLCTSPRQMHRSLHNRPQSKMRQMNAASKTLLSKPCLILRGALTKRS